MKNDTYINVLIDTLGSKVNVLDEIIQISSVQGEYLDKKPPDMEGFESQLQAKELCIEKLNRLDDGFEKIYKRIQEELKINKEAYKEEVTKLKDLIKKIMAKTSDAQALELKNKVKIERSFAREKKGIKDFKVSNQMASNYYKNMADQHQEGQSYFLDKKK